MPTTAAGAAWEDKEKSEGCVLGSGTVRAGRLLKVVWSSSLILRMEELSPEEEKHPLVNHSRARKHASFWRTDTSPNPDLRLWCRVSTELASPRPSSACSSVKGEQGEHYLPLQGLVEGPRRRRISGSSRSLTLLFANSVSRRQTELGITTGGGTVTHEFPHWAGPHLGSRGSSRSLGASQRMSPFSPPRPPPLTPPFTVFPPPVGWDFCAHGKEDGSGHSAGPSPKCLTSPFHPFSPQPDQ